MNSPLAKTMLLAVLALAPAGCGQSPAVVTDPTKLPPVSAEQVKEVRQDDNQLAAEENANPTKPTKGRQAKK